MANVTAPAFDPAPAGPVCVGFSGGLDSTALLHALTADPGIRERGLRAIHVDHGLQAASADWASRCSHACAALGVGLDVVRVQVPRHDGDGPEAAARAARHAAFGARLREGEWLALAHHRDDQAETFLLRALRGSGVDGLASMRPLRPFGTGWLWRPWLGVPRADIEAYADACGLTWIEDASNADPGFDRNFLRNEVMPLLRRRWPHAAAAFARSARLAGEARDLLEAVDTDDLALACDRDDRTLSGAVLLRLPAPRRARVLRRWVDALGLPPLPARGVARVIDDLLPARPDAAAMFRWGDACIRAWDGRLHAGTVGAPAASGWCLPWDGTAPLDLPDGGMLRIDPRVPLPAPVQVRPRTGGERIRLPGRTHRHLLKHVLQARRIPPWERPSLPLLVADDGEVLAAGDMPGARLDAWLRGRGAHLHWRRPGG